MMKNSAALIILSTLLIFSLVSCDPPTSSGLEAKCNPEVPKLADCLAYASGKSDAPTSTCCGSVSEIKDKNAVCLCYLIQQAHGGGSAAVSLGLQLDKLMQLPAACKLANASVSNCPSEQYCWSFHFSLRTIASSCFISLSYCYYYQGFFRNTPLKSQ